MIRKMAVMAVAVFSVLGLAAVPASAAGGDFPPPGCFGDRYSVPFGQGVSVTCYPGAGYGYRVIARCANGSSFWFSAGDFVPYGLGPAYAECVGGLLFPAWVAGYRVDEI